jgi:acyl-[acyl-carrier-protein] desaturase
MHVRESFGTKGSIFDEFSNAAQRAGVYTSFDYVHIMEKLNLAWDLENITGLNDQAEKARDYLVKLPARMGRIAERIVIPSEEYKFKWMQAAKI